MFTGRRFIKGRAITDYMVCAEAERDGTGTCEVRYSGVFSELQYRSVQRGIVVGRLGRPVDGKQQGDMGACGTDLMGRRLRAEGAAHYVCRHQT